MPELPEVETTVRGLKKHIVGRTVVSAWTDKEWPTKSFDGMSWSRRRKLIEGRKIKDVTRRAKYIVINFENGGSLYIHQKMTGHLLYGIWSMRQGTWMSGQRGALEDAQNQHLRAMFTLDNGKQIALSDIRRFATITYVSDPDGHKHLTKLGPEPLKISLAGFSRLFEGKKGNLKPVLMNPEFIVGIGNIYADEILWASGLHPLSRVEKLKAKDLKILWSKIKVILVRAIKLGGSSVDDYRTSTGEAGEFQNFHNAYQRTGQKCRKGDEGVIERIVVGQRSTHFCPKHQILKA